MAFGILPTGFSRKIFTDVVSGIQAHYRANLSKKINLLDATKSITQLVIPIADALADLWEVAEQTYHSLDPSNATSASAVIIGKLAGLQQEPATKGIVTVTCNLNPGTYAIGALTLNVSNEPNNRWLNAQAVTNSGVVAADFSVVFESETAGPWTAYSGTLTVITAPVTGFNSGTNPLDAQAGTADETPEELMIRRETELGAGGVNTIVAIRKVVLDVAGVQQCQVFENRSADPALGMLGNSVRVVIYDGALAAADNDAIAQAIQDKKTDGIRSSGLQSGIAIDANGDEESQFFDRATTLRIYAAAVVTGSYDPLEVKAAMSEYVSGVLGVSVSYNRLLASILSVSGVIDVTSLTLDVNPSPVETSNITVLLDQRASLDTSDIALS